MTDWEDYFAAAANFPLHPMFLVLERHLPDPGLAYDLGCGVGHGSNFLLNHGFQVAAIDIHPSAFGELPVSHPGLTKIVSPMQDVVLQPCQAILATLSLFFLPKKDLITMWDRCWDALQPGGTFMVQLLGPSDDWCLNGTCTPTTLGELDGMLDGFKVIHHEHVVRDGKDILQKPKHWDIHHMILSRVDLG